MGAARAAICVSGSKWTTGSRQFGIRTGENQITDGLTAKLTGQPGFTLIDRASVEKILKEQNFQNSDRSSADSAVRIGKLLGVGQIGLVNVYDLSYTPHPETSGRTTRTMGTMVVRANVRVVDVETAVILAEPSSAFQESVLISETTPASQFGAIRVPAKTKLNGDPTVIQKNEWAKASETITNELATKLTSVGICPGAEAGASTGGRDCQRQCLHQPGNDGGDRHWK
jgi:Curli production assembly/transport component CsgG